MEHGAWSMGHGALDKGEGEDEDAALFAGSLGAIYLGVIVVVAVAVAGAPWHVPGCV
jgi:hypothetical protein